MLVRPPVARPSLSLADSGKGVRFGLRESPVACPAAGGRFFASTPLFVSPSPEIVQVALRGGPAGARIMSGGVGYWQRHRPYFVVLTSTSCILLVGVLLLVRLRSSVHAPTSAALPSALAPDHDDFDPCASHRVCVWWAGYRAAP